MTAERSTIRKTNIDQGSLPSRLVEPALNSAPNAAKGQRRWVAVRARRPAGERVEPEVVLESEPSIRTPQMLPVPPCSDPAPASVCEPRSQPDLEILPAPAPPAEPLGYEITSGSARQLRGNIREDRVATSRPRLLPEGTHALRLVLRRSNGRRRWSLEFLVRQRNT